MGIIVEDYLSVKEPLKYQGISHRYVMTSSYDTEVSILNFGGTIESLLIPDKDGNKADVVLGHKDLDYYLTGGANHGALVGRSANRISGASFEIDGIRYNVVANDGPNNLHTSGKAYQNSFWTGKILSKNSADKLINESGIAGIAECDSEALLLSLDIADGEAGFPGNIHTDVLYAWLEDKTLLILYVGKTDKPTIFAPTNHAYFNLAGHNKGRIDDQLLMIYSDKVNKKDEFNCPDGEEIDVAGTDFDVREPRFLSDLINSSEPQITMSSGPDQNYILKGQMDAFSFAASYVDPESGRIMDVLTNFPGIQIYTGNHLQYCAGTQKGDTDYVRFGAICLEAQLVPNAVNLQGYDSPVIRPGDTKYYACGYRFTT